MKKQTFLLCSALSLGLSFSAHSQTIVTIAGNGMTGYVSDGVAATSTQLNGPAAVAVDDLGNVYVADAYNSRIRKISTTGIITTIAGTGVAGYSGDGAAATLAQIKTPLGIAVDHSGNIYFTDSDNGRIRKISATGNISTLAGDGSLGFSGDGGPATAAVLYKPLGIFADNLANLYFADGFNQRVRTINNTGSIATIAGNGTFSYSGDGGSAVAAALNGPTGVAKDAAGNVYVADKTNNRIRKISSAGVISTIAGKDTAGFSGDGGPATAAKLNNPTSVKVDKLNNIYIVDMANNRVRKIDPTGIITTIAGDGTLGSAGDGGPATAASFNFPNDVFLDTLGNIYIADQGNSRIRKIKAPSANVPAITMQHKALSLFPNPSNGSFSIELPEHGQTISLSVEDITGRVIETATLTTNSSKYSFTLSHATKGIYIVKAISTTEVYLGKLEIL
jgi:trimeric autotransporter adhesin